MTTSDRDRSGLLITFEGVEGCGKSTQARLLAERLRAAGLRVREVREPGGTPLAEEIRHTLKHSQAGAGMTSEAELLLMNAARAQLVREVIRPAMAAGEIVLCDRYYDSTLAYQGWGRGLDLAWVQKIIDFAVGSTRPHLTLLLWVPPEVSAVRTRERRNSEHAEDRFETAGNDFFRRVAEGYQALASAEPERLRMIDATPFTGQVHAAIWSLVEPHVARMRSPAPGHAFG